MFGNYGVLGWSGGGGKSVACSYNEIVFYKRQLRENGNEKINMVFNSTDTMNNTN